MAGPFQYRLVAIVMETERLILDTWQPSDWLSFKPIATDPDVMRYITGGEPWSDERIQLFVNRQIQTYTDQGHCRWKLLEKPERKLVGFCGVGFFRDHLDPEIGWWLARRCWGRGLATEAARLALRDAFERVRLERIVSIAMPENKASIAIMRKLGLHFECEFESEGSSLVRYAIHLAEYNAFTR